MTMIKGLSKEDNLIMLIEKMFFDNDYLRIASIENKLELLESLVIAREKVNALNKTRVKRAIRLLKINITESMKAGLVN